MSFGNVPRMIGKDGLDARQYSDVAGVSPDAARHARKADHVSQADRQHAKALKRAKASTGSVAEAAAKALLVTPESIKARYKIEVFFGPDRTLMGPNLCQIQFFESGKKLHGGGDELMWMCRNPDDPKLGCGGFIPGDNIRGGVAICPHCRQAIKATALTERLFGRPSTRSLAKSLAKWFRQLDSSCDIYCKFDQSDIRYVSMVKSKGTKEAHRLRGLFIYPLKNILKETANGSSLEDRFFAFLTA